MLSKSYNSCLEIEKSQGFALVIALSLMAFVLLLIISLSSFITIESAVSSNRKEQLSAQENALLGMQVALGQLQKYAGADQRSTARGDIMADNHQYWTGVWHSMPSGPGYDSTQWPVWLVSGEEDLSLNNPAEALDVAAADVVEMLPAVASAPAVLAKTMDIDSPSGTGRYAYWVGDEGTKAKFNKLDPYALASNSSADNRRITVAQRNGIETIAPTYPVNSPKIEHVRSRAQFESLTSVAIDDFYHDLTASSYTLLTDPVNGGLKRDLTSVFQASSLPAEFAEHTVFVTPDLSIYGPRWEYLSDYYNASELLSAAGGKLYPRPPYDAKPGRTSALDTNGGNGNATNPYININSQDAVTAWVKQPYFALTTELGLVLSVSSDSADFPVIRIHPFVELTNPYNIKLEGGWYEYHISNFNPTITLTLSSSDASAPTTVFSKRFMTFLKNDIPAGNVMRMLIHGDQTSIDPGRSIRLFPAGIFNASNIRNYTDTEMPMAVATEVSNWSDGYLEIRPTWDSGSRWPASVANYDRLSIDISFASSVESLSLAFYIQRYTPNLIVYNDSAYIRGAANVRNVNAANDYSYDMNWPVDPSVSQSFAIVRGKVKSADEYDPADRADFLGVFNPRSPLMSTRNGSLSNKTVSAWDWTFELGAVNPDFDTPGGIHSQYGYWGPSSTVGEGDGFDPTRTVLYDVPREPLISLGQFQNALLSLYPHEPSYAFGNSYAPNDTLAKTKWYDTVSADKLLDVSYALNTALWDGYFFSSLPEGVQVAELSDPLPSSHLEIASDLQGATQLAELQKYDQAAAHLRVDGGFNINSVSELAWAALLGSMAGLPIRDQASGAETTAENAFLRNAMPFNGAGNEWSGYKDISTDSLYDADSASLTLARSIVNEIKRRARSAGQGRPFISLAEFINRRLSNDDFGDMGTIQHAIEHSAINDDSNLFAPGSVTQADLLSALGPKLSSRSDTFVIRAMGETVSPVTGKRIASAMCEAVVERQVEYVAGSDLAGGVGNLPSDSFSELTALNQQFGRAFKVTSFRWIK